MREKVSGGWRKLQNEELHNLYPPGRSNQGEVCSTYEDDKFVTIF
jgi:hypothetical protein